VCRINGINNLRGSNTDFPSFSTQISKQTGKQSASAIIQIFIREQPEPVRKSGEIAF
jgi:hypothetical protein